MKKKAMTLNAFLARLRKTPRDWHFLYARLIRRYGTDKVQQCPLSCFIDAPSGDWYIAARGLGIGDKLAHSIINAADASAVRSFDPVLRRRLLRACGLKEA